MPVADRRCVIGIRLKPSTSREKIVSIDENEICVAVTAPPVEGKANEALVAMLAKKLQVSKSSIEIRRGLRSRVKMVAIEGMNKEHVLLKLRQDTK
ncbi:MAG TPA: DUF167 domain-containing protein [Chitinivibrionales bacterium]